MEKEKTAQDWVAEADFLLSGEKPTDSDYQQAIQCYEKAAQQHHGHALFQLGRIYLAGTGVEQNTNKAFRYFQEAAQQHHHGAEFAIYRMYHAGLGVARDHQQAFSWLVRAAEEEPLAQLKLAEFYLKGIPPAEQSRNKAIELIKKSLLAEPSPEAAILLGRIYYEGNDASAHREIPKLVQSHADQNIPEAMRLMADMYLNQKHGYPDISPEASLNLAELWLNRLMKQGDADAACQLGIHWRRRAVQTSGPEKQQLLGKAKEALQMAAKAGNPVAIKLLEEEASNNKSGLLDERQFKPLLQSYVAARQNMDMGHLSGFFARELDYQYIKGKKATHDAVMEDIREGWDNWKNRQCTYIAGGRKDNRIELIYRFHYISAQNKVIQGYAKEKWTLDAEGKIMHWREQIFKKSMPSLSPGFKQIKEE